MKKAKEINVRDMITKSNGYNTPAYDMGTGLAMVEVDSLLSNGFDDKELSELRYHKHEGPPGPLDGKPSLTPTDKRTRVSAFVTDNPETLKAFAKIQLEKHLRTGKLSTVATFIKRQTEWAQRLQDTRFIYDATDTIVYQYWEVLERWKKELQNLEPKPKPIDLLSMIKQDVLKLYREKLKKAQAPTGEWETQIECAAFVDLLWYNSYFISTKDRLVTCTRFASQWFPNIRPSLRKTDDMRPHKEQMRGLFRVIK